MYILKKLFIFYFLLGLFFSFNTIKVSAEVTSTSSPNVYSNSYPDTNKWYSTKAAVFSWELPEDVLAVSTLYDEESDSVPQKVYTPPISEKQFTVDSDGEHYMHVQFKYASGWGDITHYKFMVDTVKPESISVHFNESNLTSDPTPTVTILSNDSLSGLGHITISIDNNREYIYPISVNSEYTLPYTTPGDHIATIKAFDKAGNYITTTVEYIVKEIEAPIITNYTKNPQTKNIFELSGKTYPNSKLEILFKSENNKLYKFFVQSNTLGEFKYSEILSLKPGIYEMYLRAVDSNLASSQFTLPITVVVEYSSFMKIGMFIINWLSLIIVLIIASVASLATLWYSIVNFSQFRKKVKRNLSEVENTLKLNIASLRRDTEEFHDILVKAEKKRDLTKEEKSILKKFKKRLDTIEKEMERKLNKIR